MKILRELWENATQIACFDVDWVTVLERYCDTCIKTVEQTSDADRLNEKMKAIYHTDNTLLSNTNSTRCLNRVDTIEETASMQETAKENER